MTPKFLLDEKELEGFIRNPLDFLKSKAVESLTEKISGTLPYDEERLIEKAREEHARADKGVYFG